MKISFVLTKKIFTKLENLKQFYGYKNLNQTLRAAIIVLNMVRECLENGNVCIVQNADGSIVKKLTTSNSPKQKPIPPKGIISKEGQL